MSLAWPRTHETISDLSLARDILYNDVKRWLCMYLVQYIYMRACPTRTLLRVKASIG